MQLTILAFTVTALAGQHTVVDSSEIDLLPLIQEARVAATRAQAIENLLTMAENVALIVDDRYRAVQALCELAPTEAKERLRVLAAEVEKEEANRSGHITVHDLANAATVAYWRITVKQLDSVDEQKCLLLKLVEDKGSSTNRALGDWALSALADLGERELLPELEAAIKKRHGTATFGQDLIWLAERIVDLKESSGSPFEVFVAALCADDPTQHQLLRRWAISGLARLETAEAADALVEYALRLQDDNYDEHGIRITKDSQVEGHISTIYVLIIRTLREHGWTSDQLELAGLFPGKYFAFLE